ncbi:hypothetical protein QBC37DRAFT_175804 [Rhypophila decipiens]|uniref:Uncharacterized protein n=1 Tax=Rhypophila decipiens TaxID=261697 RepID=A0AAN7B7T6_9PEZI|nr:hypothetical protein QBC37DRAFT_175804 [Rhypophila decipiens]
MPAPQVNGDVAHTSAFVEHLVSYPVINDSVEAFKANPYGQRSIEVSTSVYQKFAAPAVPYLARPFEIVKPYVKAADDLGDRLLCIVDEKFPAVKTPTSDLIDGARALVSLPITIGSAGKEHVISTYSAEYKKCDNNNRITTVTKAGVTTTLVLTAETITFLSNYLGSKKDDVKQVANDRANN